MRYQKGLAALLLAGGVLLLAVAVAACGSGSSSSSDTASSGGKTLKYVMCVKDPTAPYQQAFRAGATDEAKKLGVDLQIRDGAADSLKIMDIMDNAIVQQADGFIMAGATDQKAIVPGVQRLNDAGIPIMALDTSPEGGKVDYYISFDITGASKSAAEAFVQGIKDRNGGKVPNGVVIYIQAPPQDMFTRACNDGALPVLKQYPQLQLAIYDGQWNNETTNQRVTDAMTRYGDQVVGVYVITPDIMATGAVEAIKSAGKDPKDYGICGICIGPEGLVLLQDGSALQIAEQPAYASAVLAVDYLTDMNNGKPTPKVGDTVTEAGAIWSPANVVKSPWADGAYVILASPLVPRDVPVDDQRLWENQLSYLWQ
jgi:ribose transport system substrate-binding protein